MNTSSPSTKPSSSDGLITALLAMFAIIGSAMYLNFLDVVNFRDYLRARDFVPVQAKIVALQIENKINTDGWKYVSIEQVRYRYGFRGEEYESTRTSIFSYLHN